MPLIVATIPPCSETSFGQLSGTALVFCFKYMTIKDIDKDNRIRKFLLSAPRFKFIVLSNESFSYAIPHINVGHVVATFLKEQNLSKEAINNAKEFLTSYIAKNTQTDEQFGKFVCLTNIGILLEKDLDFVPVNFLSNIAKNTILFLHWQGTADETSLYLLTKDSKYTIDLKNINHIII